MPCSLRFVFAAMLSLAWVASAHAQSIFIDAQFTDWSDVPIAVEDAGDANGGIDILNFSVTNDEAFLYVRFALDQEISLVDNLIAHDLFLYLDTDNDANTGFSAAPGFGSELGIRFRDRYAFFDIGGSGTVPLQSFRMRAMPTVTAAEFEVAIARDAVPDGVNPLFSGNTIKVMMRQGSDRAPDSGDTYTYVIDDSIVGPTVALALEKEDPAAIRVCGYNLNGRLTNAGAEAALQRIVSAINADVYAFSEASNVSAGYVQGLLDAWIPLGSGQTWQCVKDDFNLITASRFPIAQHWPSLDRQDPVLIDLPPSYNSQLLIVNGHFSCCDANANRQNQADEFISFILDAKNPGGSIELAENTPMMLVGDLNLVGFNQQLKTLVNGDIQNTASYGNGGAPDWDDSDFTVAYTLQSDKNMAYTWRDEGSPFPPSWLDYIIYSDAAGTALKSFTLQTGVMPAARLNQYGLLADDDLVASDHLPVVMDYLPNLVTFEDSDEDGIPDNSDNCPNDFNPDQADFNSDGIGDACQDSDGDGLSDAEELLLGSNPEVQDSDGDGLTDGAEVLQTFTNPNLWDSNGNGLSDLEDLLQGTSTCVGDLNQDSQVNSADLLLFLGAFGNGCL